MTVEKKSHTLCLTYPYSVTPAILSALRILSASPVSIVLSCSNKVSAALQASK